nr:MAG: RNA-dependent RNA polymerase [Chemarfal virus 266]
MANTWRVETWPCHACHKQCYELLSKPLQSECFVTSVAVPQRCEVCAIAGCFGITAPPDNVVVDVYMPARLVADSMILIKKLEAQSTWAQKGANLDLQLVNLVQPTSAAKFAYAYSTVGLAALSCRSKKDALFPTLSCLAGICGGQTRARSNWRWVDANPNRPARGDEPTSVGGDGKPSKNGGDGPSSKPKSPNNPNSRETAERATEVERQQAAFIEGDTLKSTTVNVGHDAPNVKDTGSPNQDEVGQREAHARFPQLSQQQQYLFNNNPQNLAAANALRNWPTVNVGNHTPAPRHARRADMVVEWLKGEVFTHEKMKRALIDMTTYSGFPTKYSDTSKAAALNSAMVDATSQDGVAWSKFVKAFVKAEVTAKPKPRPIANHGPERLAALAQVAYVYEHVLFESFEKASIKHRTMRVALKEIITNMSKVKGGDVWFENDLSSFEFGISKELKEYEVRLFRHIALYLQVLDVGEVAFDRIVNSRTRQCVWTMSYVDEAGQRSNVKIQMPNVMRESGDRVTSSGNWLQNFIAWTVFLSDDVGLQDSLRKFLQSHGKNFFYVSDRDGKKHLARLAFEGDDTLGRLSEFEGRDVEFINAAEEFFRTWGWSPKLKAVVNTGVVTFVGRQVYLENGVGVVDNDELVTTPEINRFLDTKSWSTSHFRTTEEQRLCTRLYAAAMAKDFANLEPMYALCCAIYNANLDAFSDLGALSEEARRGLAETSFRMTGDYNASAQLAAGNIADCLPAFEGGGEVWRDYAMAAAGPCSDLEWATMCGLRCAKVHGQDLAAFVPEAWHK